MNEDQSKEIRQKLQSILRENQSLTAEIASVAADAVESVSGRKLSDDIVAHNTRVVLHGYQAAAVDNILADPLMAQAMNAVIALLTGYIIHYTTKGSSPSKSDFKALSNDIRRQFLQEEAPTEREETTNQKLEQSFDRDRIDNWVQTFISAIEDEDFQ